MECRAEILTKAPTHAERNECFNTTPGMRLRTADCVQLLKLCGKALWKMEIKGKKWRFFMACQLFYSKGHFNRSEMFG